MSENPYISQDSDTPLEQTKKNARLGHLDHRGAC